MLDRTLPPPSFSVDHVNLVEATGFKLDNDIAGHYIDAGDQPVLRLEFIFKAGKRYEQLPGVSFFSGKMLQEGTTTWSAKELHTIFESLGAFIEITPGFDHITVTVHHLTKHLERLLPVIKEILYDPLFGEDELNNLKRIKQQQLQVDLQRNEFLASRKFRELLFGDNHAYGRNLDLKSIEIINNRHLREHFNSHMFGEYEIIVSGKITPKEIALINKVLGNEETRAPRRLLPNSQIQYLPQEVLIDKEDSLQSSIRMGMPCIARDHPDYWYLAIVNEVLGGYFGSRLMKNVREERGYTYGIHSVLSHLKDFSMFYIGTEVKKEHRTPAIFEITKEIKKLQRELMPLQELQTVTNYMAGSFAAEIDSPFAIADKFKTLHFSGLNYDHYQKLFATLRDINPEDILKISRKHLVVEQFSRVVVG